MKTRKVRARQWGKYLQSLEKLGPDVQIEFMGWRRQGGPRQREIWRKFKRCQKVYICRGISSGTVSKVR